jgi:hypothetical protein
MRTKCYASYELDLHSGRVGLGSTERVRSGNALIMNTHTNPCDFHIVGAGMFGFRLWVRGFGPSFASAEREGRVRGIGDGLFVGEVVVELEARRRWSVRAVWWKDGDV